MRSFPLAAALTLTSASLACTPVVLGGGGGAGAGGSTAGSGGAPVVPPPPRDAGPGTDGNPGTSGNPGTGGSFVVAQAPRLLARGDITCLLGAAGHLACWGDDETGQLGLGDFLDRRTPTWIPGFAGVIDVAVGDIEMCARKADGTVWCWADDFYGELDATLPFCPALGTTCSAVPVLSMAQAPGPLAFGDHGFCSVKPAGDLGCWGATPPADVSGYHVLSAAVGYDHLCVIFAPEPGQDPARNVVCSGDDNMGQLGTGPSSPPGPVAGDAPFVDIAAGDEYTCGVDTAGGMWCWGSNQFGALGVGAPTDDSTFPESCLNGACSHVPLAVPGLPPVAHVAAHYSQVCAQAVDGHVYCWGTPSHTSPGSVDACFSNNPDCSPTPVLVAGVAGATSITVGNGHACSLTGPSEVTCWGLDTHGQLGRGPGPDWDPAPVAVTIPMEPM